MSLSNRIRKLETAVDPDECPDCRTLHRSIILRGDEPEPDPEPCARCGRLRPQFIIRLIRTDPDGREA